MFCPEKMPGGLYDHRAVWRRWRCRQQQKSGLFISCFVVVRLDLSLQRKSRRHHHGEKNTQTQLLSMISYEHGSSGVRSKEVGSYVENNEHGSNRKHAVYNSSIPITRRCDNNSRTQQLDEEAIRRSEAPWVVC